MIHPIRLFEKKMKDAFPTIYTNIDSPEPDEGMWFLDLDLESHWVVVTWFKTIGFGLFCKAETEYANKCDEFYETLDDAFERACYLLRTRTSTESESEKTLRVNGSKIAAQP